MKKADWETIKAEYITGNVSYRVLSNKYNIPFRTVSDKGKKENWTKLRKEYRDDVVKKTVKRVSARVVTDNAAKLVSLQQSADAMSTAIARVFDDADQFHRHLVTSDFETEERVYKKIDTKAIRDLTGAMRDLAIVLRNVYNIPTVQEQAAMDVAAERLKLEKQKADIGGSEEAGGGVVEIAAVLPEGEDGGTNE